MARTQVATFEVISTTPNPSTISDGRNKHSRGEADFLIENHGSIFGFTPLNANARIWLDENVQAESWQMVAVGGRNMKTQRISRMPRRIWRKR